MEPSESFLGISEHVAGVSGDRQNLIVEGRRGRQGVRRTACHCIFSIGDWLPEVKPGLVGFRASQVHG
jgi:hypothetical protein